MLGRAMGTDRLLTVDDVAAELRVPRATAYEYMAQMVRVVTGRHVRVTRRALDAWIEQHTCEPTPSRNSTVGAASGGATGRTTAGRLAPLTKPKLAASSGIDTTRVTYPRKRRT